MNRLGFTLIELMIVVAIIGILAVVAVPMYGKYIDESAKAESNTNLVDIAAKQETYFRTWNKYVTANTGYASSAHDGKEAMSATALADWQKLGFDPAGPTYWTYGTLSKDDTAYTVCAARKLNGGIEYAVLSSTNRRAVVYGAVDRCKSE